MATVSIPTRSGSLAEAQTRVRHPLARVRTIIRAYVGLEGAALLFTLLALWFWVTFATDFGAFRSVGVDWVQLVSRPVRALVLGAFFLAAVFCLRSGLIMRMIGPDLIAIYTAALALGKRQTMPVWLRLPLLGMLVAIIGLALWGVDLLLAYNEASLASHGWLSIIAGLVLGLSAFLLSGCHEVFGVRNRSSLPMMLRAPLAAIGSGFGAFVGYLLGKAVGNLAFAALFAGLLAPVGDVGALCALSFGALLLRGRGLAFLITSSLALCYLALWVGLGLLVNWVSADWSAWFGAFGVAFLLIAPVAFVIVSRLTTDFRDTAIALVLERRFPKILGDRLITAIDLAEPKKHTKYGYSLPMMEATIRDAAERIDQVPVASVFDWVRLARYFVMVLVCTLGLYLFLIANAVRVGLEPGDSAGLPIMIAVWLVNVFLLVSAGYLMVRRGGVAGIFVTCVLVFGFLWAYVQSALTHALSGPNNSFQSKAFYVALGGLAGCIALGSAYIFVRKKLGGKLDLVIAALTVGIILVVTGTRAADASENAKAINETAGLWMERNVFLQNTIWPRRAHLIVLDPNEEDKRVGKDDAAPTLRVRALHWVVVEPKSDEGWRALTWHDLQTNKALLGEKAPDLKLPAGWGNPRDPNGVWTVDELEMRLDQPSGHEDIDPETAKLLRDTISEKLEARVADPAMRRTMRKLIVPPTIAVTYWGDSTRGTMNLSRAGENEYTGPFPALKESVRYSARGEDYTTPTRKISVVPPPTLTEITSEEHQAAYRFYRVAGGEQDQLKGLKQLVPARKLSLLGGDTTRVDGVPAGSDVILTAKTDKDLNPERVKIEAFRAGAPAIVGEVSVPEKRTIRIVFNNVRSTPQQPALDFVLKYVDIEGVSGARHIVLKPVDDNPPDVNVGYEVLRKTSAGIMITPQAKIPLGGSNFTDDVGLTKIEYVMTYSKLDRGAEATARSLVVLSTLQKIAGGPGQEYAAASEIGKIARDLKTNAGNEGEKTYGPMVYKPFEKELKQSPSEFYRIDDILLSLGTKPPRIPLTKKYVIPDKQDPTGTDYFIDVEALGVRVDEGKMTQPRYRMQFWMEATDNNVDSGPGRGIAKEKLTFVIVPENELLAEIAKEQDGIYSRVLDSATKLQETVAKLNQMKSSLLADEIKDEQLKSMVIRCEDLLATLGKTEADVAAAHADLSRILIEIKQNRVQQSRVTKLERMIVEPLQEGLKPRDDKAVDNFPKCKDGVEDLRGILNGNDLNLSAKIANSRKKTDEATYRLEALIKRLNDVLDQMREIGNEDDLKRILLELKAEEERQNAILKIMEYYAKIRNEESIFGPGKPK